MNRLFNMRRNILTLLLAMMMPWYPLYVYSQRERTKVLIQRTLMIRNGRRSICHMTGQCIYHMIEMLYIAMDIKCWGINILKIVWDGIVRL